MSKRSSGKFRKRSQVASLHPNLNSPDQVRSWLQSNCEAGDLGLVMQASEETLGRIGRSAILLPVRFLVFGPMRLHIVAIERAHWYVQLATLSGEVIASWGNTPDGFPPYEIVFAELTLNEDPATIRLTSWKQFDNNHRFTACYTDGNIHFVLHLVRDRPEEEFVFEIVESGPPFYYYKRPRGQMQIDFDRFSPIDKVPF